MSYHTISPVRGKTAIILESSMIFQWMSRFLVRDETTKKQNVYNFFKQSELEPKMS